MRQFLLSFILLGFLTVPALAAEENSEMPPPEMPTVKSKTTNPFVGVMIGKAKELADSLTEEESQALGHIRENFGILRSIMVARESVEEAVGLCASANPELEEDITARFNSWDDDIGTALNKQEKNLAQAVSKENFREPERVKDYLDSIDDMAEYADEQIEKKVITTPPACRNLMESMDDTSAVILDLITDMDWPGGQPQAESGQEQEKAEEQQETTP